MNDALSAVRKPAHHDPSGGFRDPWDDGVRVTRGFPDFLRWTWQRWREPLPPDPAPDAIPTDNSSPAYPRTVSDEARATWIGHATFLVQVGGVNLLTDAMFSQRASPVSFVGPKRFRAPGLALDALPPVDAVLLSHDHFDHLDRPSVAALLDRFGPELPFVTPLGYRSWFTRRGAREVRELDWWQEIEVGTPERRVRVTAAPCRHWTRRRWTVNRRLWASYAVHAEGAPSVYFGADSGYSPAYTRIGERLGPFDLVLLPIGAYEPRWFMRGAHMNPEDAVQAYRDLGARGAFVGMHWGTFRLTDEDPLEPPERTRRAWAEAGLPSGDLHLPGIGGTVVVRGRDGSVSRR
jgi:N-acyl-phosphatidylethanolamine-hydrolysing phospholipase D